MEVVSSSLGWKGMAHLKFFFLMKYRTAIIVLQINSLNCYHLFSVVIGLCGIQIVLFLLQENKTGTHVSLTKSTRLIL